MPADPAEQLAQHPRAFLIAAAGCGKTETVVRAAGMFSEGRQLVLTHTHAGVKALKDRLKRVGAEGRRVHVDTIAGFSLRYAASFPRLSGIVTAEPRGQDWAAVYGAGRHVMDASVGGRVLRESYAGIYVDEYQDCTVEQHELIMAMAALLPCRVVLDPLQCIFDFGGAEVVSVERHVATSFERLPDLETPYRWRTSNPALGDWLVAVRGDIIAGRPIALKDAPIERGLSSRPNQLSTCFRVAQREGSVVAIGSWPNDCFAIARNLRGIYTVMEPIECPDLLDAAKALEAARGPARAVVLIDFASACLTAVGTELRPARTAFARGDFPIIRSNSANRRVLSALAAVAGDDTFRPLADAIEAIESMPGSVLHRRELWREMARTVRLKLGPDAIALEEAAWRVRDTGRQRGRRVEHRTVSRTVLVKGLEFDHALILSAHRLSARNLYVALTRGSRSLTVLSDSDVLATAA